MLGLTKGNLKTIINQMRQIEQDEYNATGYHKLSGGFADVVMYKFTIKHVVLHLKSGINGEPDSINRREILLDRNNFMAVISNE